MKKHLLSVLLCSFLSVTVWAQPMMRPMGPENEFSALEGTTALNFNFHFTRDVKARAGQGPAFYLFPDQKLDEQSALKLAQELGVIDWAKNYAGGVCVVNPAGEKWTAADVQAFHDLLGKCGPVTNIKVVGIGAGATFVNQQLAVSDLVGAIAGIVSLNGLAGKTCALPVPAYIGGKGAVKAAKPYQAASKTAPADPLQQVVVNPNAKATLTELMAEAWEKVLCKNYRYNNLYRTFYMTRGVDNPEDVKNYELVSFPMFEELGIQRNVVEYVLEDHNRSGNKNENPDKYLWYEYLPKQAQQAAAKTVPLVVILHGHGNDARTQSETSGFTELAAEEGFMVVEMEWQGTQGYIAMGLDGIEGVIEVLLKKYPQIDPSRIYCEGLSAGAMTCNMLGVRKSHLFAAVAGHSGGIFSGDGTGYYGYGSDPILNEAKQKRGFVETGFVNIAGTDDDVIRYLRPDHWKDSPYLNVWRIYETLNGMEVTGDLDFKVDSTFGLKLQDREQIHTGKGQDITIESGLMYKGDKPLIKLMAINHYGHWNFKPAARLIWDFWRHFSRDPETKKLNYTK